VPDEPTSISFDRASEYYDRTRALSPPVQRRVIELLVHQLSGEGACLEIGIGTGRMALPLFEAGIDMAGLDISEPMLGRLVANAGGRVPFALVRADATALPFEDDSFGAALTSHVLHLISAWRDAIAEIIRVVQPGGVFLNNLGGWNDTTGPWLELQERFAAEAGLELEHIGAKDVSEVDDAMAAYGATAGRRLDPITDSKVSTLKHQLEGFAEGRWSFTWRADEAVRRAAVKRLTPWAEERFGGPDARFEFGTEIVWTAYRLQK
jgi:SAM-dependent methyltransferase